MLWQGAWMHDRRTAATLFVAGLVLLALGLGCWASGLDLRLHPAFRLAGAARTVARVSALGRPGVLVPVALVAIALLALRRRWRDALWLVATIGGARLLVELIKAIVHRPRPPLFDRLEAAGSWSFPSAHAANMMATALALALVAGGGRLRLGAALAVALVIGWTRLALAVHWPGDVLGGWGVGLAWVGLAARLRVRGAAA